MELPSDLEEVDLPRQSYPITRGGHIRIGQSSLDSGDLI